ncbi:MAG TPA: glycoside hydrolase family 76 protein [Candidatus Acidoferrales bacterium]|nr:glycoside hydrolase family 76 protein [Candidatus Acidoferrales bacterium]
MTTVSLASQTRRKTGDDRVRYLIIIFFVLAFVPWRSVAMPDDDFAAHTVDAVSALHHWYNPNTGLWKHTGWWNSANCLQGVEATLALSHDQKDQAVIENTFNRNAANNFLNDYYDDEGWWAETWIRAYDLTGQARYLNAAKVIFQDMTNGWDSHCDGGLWWSKKRTYKNAIPNELFLLVAIRLHQRTAGDGGPGSYFYWATNEWHWFQASGMLNSQNLVNDGLTSDCLNNGDTTWTYNQGVILGALADLYKVTGETNYLARAEAIVDASISTLIDQDGVLTEPCESNGCHGGDVPQFKGIFIRNLAYLYSVDRKPAYLDFISRSAHSVWENDRNNKNQLGLKWAGPFDSADPARQSSAVMALAALAELSKTTNVSLNPAEPQH